MTGTYVATYARERMGLSAFVIEDGIVYHTYSTYSHGVERHLERVPVARPRPQGAQRDGLLVAPPRRVRQGLSNVVGLVAQLRDRRSHDAWFPNQGASKT